MRGIKRPLVIKIIILAGLLLYFTPQAVAWKPVSHVHLAEVARLDALDDGKVEIFLVDYESGEILSKLGDYEVEPNILKALREGSSYYRAGAFAADFIPDLAFSQLLVHPKRTRTSSDTWLKELWDGANRYYLPPESNVLAFTKAARIKAFVLGFLTHAAGDMYGHSYINEFAGGAWELNEIAMRHMFIEGYIDKRTPDTSPDFYSTSITGIEDFIYDHMINKLDLTGYSDFEGGNFNIEDNVPARIFAGLSKFLESQINGYLNTLAEYDRKYRAKVQEAENCKPTDFGCSRILLYRQAAAILLEKNAYALFWAPVMLYCQNWIKDIDEGLKAFISPSYQAHLTFFQKPNTYYPSPDAALQDWGTDHLLSMVGLPDVVGQIVGYDLIMELIPQVLKDKFEDMKASFFNYIMKSALGMTLQELEDMLNSITEPVFFNSVPTLFPNNGCWMSMSDFNLCELKIQDTAYDNPDEKYDWHTFRPAYNTVTMNKLLLLSQAGLRQLLTDLGYSEDTSELRTPAILGFIDSFDRSNQGINPSGMVLAKDPTAYKKIFMRQRGVQLKTEAQGVPCGCRQPEEQKPEETQEEEVTFDDLAGKFSHIELSGKLHDMVVNDEFLVVQTEAKKKGQVITVFSEPKGALLWKRKFSQIPRSPGIFLFKDRIAVAVERARPYRFLLFDANTGKKIDEIHPPIWEQVGRYLVSQYGDVYDMQKCLLHEYPAEEKADAKAIVGKNVLYWTRTAKPPRKESLVLRSLDSRNVLWKKTKLPEKERIFFRNEMVAGNRMKQNDFPVLFPIRIRYRKGDEPFPFYFLKKNGEGKWLHPDFFGLTESSFSARIDFSFTIRHPRQILVAGINTIFKRKLDTLKEIIVALDDSGKMLGRTEISLRDNTLLLNKPDSDGNLLLFLRRIRPESGNFLVSYRLPDFRKNYEVEVAQISQYPEDVRMIEDKIFIWGRSALRVEHVVLSLDARDGSLISYFPFGKRGYWHRRTSLSNLQRVSNRKHLFVPWHKSSYDMVKNDRFYIFRIPLK